uniref:Uncharacterized protein n=1 Tax=Oncorhynchus tshawytscha TaxID=74940 RepID=A0AAZ3RMG4_ONCTS
MGLPISLKEGISTQDERCSYLERTSSFGSNLNFSCESDQSLHFTYFIKEGDYEPRIQPGEVVCDICSEVKAVKFCQTCSVSYCETHIRQHYTIAALQRHTVVDVTGDLVQKLCQHDFSPLDVFCRTDQMLICSQCAETNHKGHDTFFHNREQAGRQVFEDEHQSQNLVDVLLPPGEIQFLSVTSDSVSLSWGPPEGLTRPQRFRVTWGCEGQTNCSLRVKGGYHLEINGLKPGEKYQFNVVTEGDDGRQSGLVSASVFTVVPTPRELKVDQIGATSFTLHWSKAAGMEQTPQGFLIFLCCQGTEPSTDITEDCNKTFFNLKPNNQYIVSVSTVLTNGEQSTPVFSTICTRKTKQKGRKHETCKIL